jgi:hypothetical protein
MTVPMMQLTWGRVGYLASVVFSTFQHIHNITEFPIWAGRVPQCERVTDWYVR